MLNARWAPRRLNVMSFLLSFVWVISGFVYSASTYFLHTHASVIPRPDTADRFLSGMATQILVAVLCLPLILLPRAPKWEVAPAYERAYDVLFILAALRAIIEWVVQKWLDATIKT